MLLSKGQHGDHKFTNIKNFKKLIKYIENLQGPTFNTIIGHFLYCDKPLITVSI